MKGHHPVYKMPVNAYDTEPRPIANHANKNDNSNVNNNANNNKIVENQNNNVNSNTDYNSPAHYTGFFAYTP